MEASKKKQDLTDYGTFFKHFDVGNILIIFAEIFKNLNL
jgi:hypothetical protein